MGDNAMDKAKGKAKEMLGKATGNERMKTEGKVDQAKADTANMGDKAKDKLKGVRDSLSDDDN
ncbi:CsbD family protein [Streptomyces sp. cg28]|uniref:CsbD family protein n=1 Tax=Streptomyces tabacisoli TaxID=3156398 RepID=A0AAU8IM98_9ACTN|nr:MULTISPECIES: CsbD family protein [unclassified Streptomyces]MYT75740.1 CsbD family protein [Streptomyces sp. SID8367]RAJ87149.1 CsbD-like protein [Streptomyces sp. PsTaAH-137]